MTITVAIAVPVRNEAQRLPHLLAALARQVDAPPFLLALFFDGCHDDGPAIVDALAPTLPFAVAAERGGGSGVANAGLARRRACALASASAPAAALLTTDADSLPADDWVARSLVGLARADLVLGRIVTAPGDGAPMQRRLSAYLDRLYQHRRRLDPVAWEDAATHHWTSAASLGFRPDAYRSIGGFAALPRGEDADICDRAWRAGLRVRRDVGVEVTTSTRRDGRTPHGFAGLLATLDRDGAMPMVAHPDDEVWRYRTHAAARAGWAAGVFDALAVATGLDPAALRGLAAECVNAEAFTARAVGEPVGGMRHVTLANAEPLLDRAAVRAMAPA